MRRAAPRQYRRFRHAWSIGVAGRTLAGRDVGEANLANPAQDAPPGNRLEALVGDHVGQRGIRVNNQFRVRFVWTTLGPKNVEIVDYH